MTTTGKIDIKRAVQNGAKVTFQFYRKGDLWYQTAYGETFSVPVSDVGDGVFMAEEKGILFMRYMREWNEALEAEEKS